MAEIQSIRNVIISIPIKGDLQMLPGRKNGMEEGATECVRNI